MEKVKVTQEQAGAVEWFKKEHQEKLGDMSLRSFYDALRYGYEVEPEYKVGEYIVYENEVVKNTMKIIDIEAGDILVEPIYEGFENYNRVSVTSPSIRYATPSEIAKEKERRFFARNGRKPWELLEDDILEYLGDLLIVDSFDSEDVCFRRSKGSIDDYFENLDYVKEHFKVVCFAESRLDVKTNE